MKHQPIEAMIEEIVFQAGVLVRQYQLQVKIGGEYDPTDKGYEAWLKNKLTQLANQIHEQSALEAEGRKKECDSDGGRGSANCSGYNKALQDLLDNIPNIPNIDL